MFLFLLLFGGLAAGAWYLYGNIESERDRTSAQILLLNQQIAELASESSDTLGAQQNIERTLANFIGDQQRQICLLYTSPSPRDLSTSRMPSSA